MMKPYNYFRSSASCRVRIALSLEGLALGCAGFMRRGLRDGAMKH